MHLLEDKLANMGRSQSDKEIGRLGKNIADSAYNFALNQVTEDYQRYGGVVNLTKCMVMRIGRENGGARHEDILKWYQGSGIKPEEIDGALKLALDEGMLFEKEKGLYGMPFSVIAHLERKHSL